MIAAVKVRGDIDARHKVKRTLEDLKLREKNQCLLIEENDSIEGMLELVKDYIAYGEIDEETVEKIEEEKGEVEKGSVVNLAPPSGGFRDTKKQVGQGGSLGKHENMDQLVQKMV